MIIIVSTPLRIVASYAVVFAAGALLARSQGKFRLSLSRKCQDRAGR